MALAKGSIIRLRGRKMKVHGALDFQFNPSQVTRAGSVEWQWGQGPGAVLPVATFAKMGEMTLSLELLFDAREGFQTKLGGLRGVLAEAESIGLPAVDRWHANRFALAVAPDRVVLVLGQRRWYCQCTSWNVVEEMWNEKLDPVRARVSYTLRMVNTGTKAIEAYVKNLKKWRENYEGRPLPGEPTIGGIPTDQGGSPFSEGIDDL